MKNRPPLPPPCANCGPTGGAWRNWGTEEAPRMDRCDCARGKALGLGKKWGAVPRKKRTAVFDGKAAAQGNR